jgi:hypothetical protein
MGDPLDDIKPWHTGPDWSGWVTEVELDEARIGLLLSAGWKVAGIRLGSYIRLVPADGGASVLIPLDRTAPDYGAGMRAAVTRLREIVACGAATAPALTPDPVAEAIAQRERRGPRRAAAVSPTRLARETIGAAAAVRTAVAAAKLGRTPTPGRFGRDEILAGLARVHALTGAHLIAGGQWTEDRWPPRDVLDAWALTLRIDLPRLRALAAGVTPLAACEDCGHPLVQLPPELTDGRQVHALASDALTCPAGGRS